MELDVATNWAMALSFLYLAFVRNLELLGLVRHDSEELAVEVVIVRHEVTDLRRRVARPALRRHSGVVDDLQLDDPIRRHSCELSLQRRDPREGSLAFGQDPQCPRRQPAIASSLPAC